MISYARKKRRRRGFYKAYFLLLLVGPENPSEGNGHGCVCVDCGTQTQTLSSPSPLISITWVIPKVGSSREEEEKGGKLVGQKGFHTF